MLGTDNYSNQLEMMSSQGCNIIHYLLLQQQTSVVNRKILMKKRALARSQSIDMLATMLQQGSSGSVSIMNEKTLAAVNHLIAKAVIPGTENNNTSLF